MKHRHTPVVAVLTVAIQVACGDTFDLPEAVGLPPEVEVDAAFGETPLIGLLHITPVEGSDRWRWHVTGLGGQADELMGIAEGPVSVPYRHTMAGVHVIRVELSGPGGPVVVEKRVVAHESATELEILAQRSTDEIFDARPEGMTIDPEGRELFAGAYVSGELVRLDSSSLATLNVLMLPAHSVEGLTVTPAGRYLVAVHERSGATVVDLEDFQVFRQGGPGRGWVRAWDEDRVLVTESGNGRGEGLRRVNIETGEIEASSRSFIPGHFDIDPSGDRIAVTNCAERSVDILEASFLTRIRSVFTGDYRGKYVAFDPREEKIYVLSQEGRLLVVDLTIGQILESIPLCPTGDGLSFNPIAVFGGGRYIAFDCGGGVVIVDTELDMPRYRFNPQGEGNVAWASVAAITDSDFLFVLTGPEGRLRKIRIR